MKKSILFITGKLAENNLRKILERIENNKKTKDKISSKDKNTKSVSQPQQGQPKKSGLKPVESKKKEKKIVPTRAANDPRYKS